MWLVLISLVFILTLVIMLSGALPPRWSLLRFAILLGWFGPLPGCFYAAVSASWRSIHGFGEFLGYIAGLIPSVFYLYFVAAPVFGSYCFVVSLFGGWIVSKTTAMPIMLWKDSAHVKPLLKIVIPSWAQPVAIVGISALAAVPVILLTGGLDGPIGTAAVASSAFWCATFFLFRQRIFPIKPTVQNGAQ